MEATRIALSTLSTYGEIPKQTITAEAYRRLGGMPVRDSGFISETSLGGSAEIEQALQADPESPPASRHVRAMFDNQEV